MTATPSFSNVLGSKPIAIWVALGFFGVSHFVNVLFFGDLIVFSYYHRFGHEFLNIQNFLGSLTSVAAFIALLCRIPIARRVSLLALSIYFSNAVSRLRVDGFALEPSAEFLRASATLAFILLMFFLFSRSVSDHLDPKASTSATP